MRRGWAWAFRPLSRSAWPATRPTGPPISTVWSGPKPQITAAFTLTGEADYLLRVWCADLQALHRLLHGLILPHPSVARVQSQIVMDQMKPDAPLPI